MKNSKNIKKIYSVIKQENNKVKLGKNPFKMFVNKNAILSWEWARVIVRIRCDRGVPRFQKLSGARIGRCFYIPYVFFFPRSE